jgi:hypothetical protein
MNEAPAKLPGDRPRLSAWLAFAILLAAVLVVFGRTVAYDFILLDDGLLIYANPHVVGPFPQCLATAWQGTHRHLYIPLVYNVWAILAQFTGGSEWSLGARVNPMVYHLANVLVHGLNACLVYLVLRRLVEKPWPALAGALLWAIHPLQVEPVAWATGMKDLLSATFALAAMLCYLAAARRDAGGSFPRGGALGWWLGAALCLAAASLAKPAVVTVPLAILVLDAFVLKRGWKVAFAWSLPLLLAVAPAVMATTVGQGLVMRASLPLLQRPVIAGFSFFHYLAKIFLPYGLVLDSGLPPQVVLDSTACRMCAALGGATLLVVLVVRPLRRWAGAPLLVMLLLLLPVLGFVGFLFQNFSVVSDRYMYLAMLGPALGVAWLLQSAKLASPRGVAVVAVLVILGVVSSLQVSAWQDSQTVCEHTLKYNPRSALSLTDLALLEINSASQHDQRARSLAREGRLDLATQEHDEAFAQRAQAIKELHKALTYEPEFVPAWERLIYALEAQDRLDELGAVIDYLLAWQKRDPVGTAGLPLDPRKTAQLYLRLNRFADARRCLQEHLRAHPDDVRAQALLAQIPTTMPATRP